MNALSVPWVVAPVDVPKAALLLASDETRHIAGTTLPVDTGECEQRLINRPGQTMHAFAGWESEQRRIGRKFA